ncbi:hypothetical protein DYB28_013379 [Aphanomyces astaci]|uniref:Uncharacterized protein n=1 Tax=Aphanomyces astaci TaxID=112090 RepID=A0A397F0Z4_APHAT|nr:hypothetical protein DYB30_001209 [Aphanomyces astaci]RHZ04803.1 hypothetical protein DYB31_008330 [Aphanomyces astaci]RHZ18744.1 hypothetical protein DYB26_005877 [Aphanomyces astaci]RLO03030.1 hypothetical protein DYB28_013379 [Aphanomyces astaci]
MFQTWVHGIFNPRQVQSCPDPITQHIRGGSDNDSEDADSRASHSSRPRANTFDDTTTASRRRSDVAVSAWDSKREMCQNCKHIYLKFLSPCTTAGFCSLDCQSNAVYLLAVSEGIRAAAAKADIPLTTIDSTSCNAPSHAVAASLSSEKEQATTVMLAPVLSKMSCGVAMSEPKEVAGSRSAEPVSSPATQESCSSTMDFDQYDDSDYDTIERHTYSDFYTEKLKLARAVEWNFSALY